MIPEEKERMPDDKCKKNKIWKQRFATLRMPIDSVKDCLWMLKPLTGWKVIVRIFIVSKCHPIHNYIREDISSQYIYPVFTSSSNNQTQHHQYWEPYFGFPRLCIIVWFFFFLDTFFFIFYFYKCSLSSNISVDTLWIELYYVSLLSMNNLSFLQGCALSVITLVFLLLLLQVLL